MRNALLLMWSLFYFSIATGADKPLTVNTAETSLDPELHGNTSLATTTSIANDVSLATTRVDTDDDQYEGLDLSVGTRKISSQLFDTKSLEMGGIEQPLDLTCAKGFGVKEEDNRESPSSSQMDLNCPTSEFNYVYVYPGLYPPGAVINANDDLEPHQGMTSPVPELMSPGKIPSPDTLSRAQYLATTEALETAYAMTNNDNRFKDYTKRQTSPPSISPAPFIAPKTMKRELGEVESKPRIAPSPTKSIRGKPKDNKRSTEMKVISENTSAGVYTSVMKLPWSRRTRTRKPKHKVKLEDTLIPQFMLEQNQSVAQGGEMTIPSQSPAISPVLSYSTPNSAQSVMMVYPNATNTAYGKPMKKRGRPPKLPMLAKLLHHRIGKKGKQETETEDLQAQITQQVQASGGMVMYNAEGQLTSAYPNVQPTPAQCVPFHVPTSSISTPPPLLSPVPQIQVPSLPNMAQAQFLGQIPLSQITGGPIQFLGQFPANAIPFNAQALQAIPIPVSSAESQLLQTAHRDGTDNGDENKTQASLPQLGVQYAFQPMFIPHQMPVPMPQVTPVPVPADDTLNDDTDLEVATESSIQTTAVPTMITAGAGSSQSKQMSDYNTVSTMSTTSISNTDSGVMYQEMILSSKSLVDVKKRRRKTAIQMLKSKAGENDFLCTSFRIRPRLVAQAQAQRERQAAKGTEESTSMYQKNLISPQSDSNHFGENNGVCNVDFSNIQIKQEIDEDDDVYASLKEYELNAMKKGDVDALEGSGNLMIDESKLVVTPKRYMLKGSQKRKAKFYGSRIVNEQGELAMKNLGRKRKSGLTGVTEMETSDMYQEMFNCKICNKIISVDDMESHSLDHLKSTVYQCTKCGRGYGEAQVKLADKPMCTMCNEPLVTVGDLSENGESRIACDECSETFKSLPEFYEHKTAHRNSQNAQGEFECDFCGKIYQYYHALQFHRRTHRERRVPCMDKLCGLKFRSRKEMENHFDSNHPDKKEYFHCVYEGCTKKFLKNFHLQEHIRVKHYNIKAFQCPWPGCSKEFAAQRHLKIHLLIHRDEKPMKCDHCDYRCRQRSAMNWHMRKHPDVPYKYKRALKSPSISKSESE